MKLASISRAQVRVRLRLGGARVRPVVVAIGSNFRSVSCRSGTGPYDRRRPPDGDTMRQTLMIVLEKDPRYGMVRVEWVGLTDLEEQWCLIWRNNDV